MEEIWKPVVGYEGLYEVSSLGKIKSLKFWKERILKWWKDKDWYMLVVLCNKKVNLTSKIHRLVARSFIQNPENRPQVNHINWIKTDNRVENLEWCTVSENWIHKYRILKIPHPRWWLWKIRIWKYNKLSRRVIQYDKNMVIIWVFEWANDASRILWISRWSISKVCNWKNKTSGWFIWRYE